MEVLKTRFRPSGEMAIGLTPVDFSAVAAPGGVIRKLAATGWAGVSCRKYLIANGSAARNDKKKIAAAIQGTRSRQTERLVSATATAAAVVSPLPEELVGADSASSAKLRSAVDSNRRSGFFSRHRLTILSN